MSSSDSWSCGWHLCAHLPPWWSLLYRLILGQKRPFQTVCARCYLQAGSVISSSDQAAAGMSWPRLARGWEKIRAILLFKYYSSALPASVATSEGSYSTASYTGNGENGSSTCLLWNCRLQGLHSSPRAWQSFPCRSWKNHFFCVSRGCRSEVVS